MESEEDSLGEMTGDAIPEAQRSVIDAERLRDVSDKFAEIRPDTGLLEKLLPGNWAKANPHRLVKEPQAANHA